MSRLAVVCGNPKPKSRTLEAASLIAARLRDTPADHVLDLVDLGPELLTWGSPAVTRAVADISACDYVVFASPTYKGTYTGLLKLFLDQFAADSLDGTIAFPVMLGAAWGHALAPDVFLKPVLTEIGASCPVRGLYLLETDYTSDAALDPWLLRARRFVA